MWIDAVRAITAQSNSSVTVQQVRCIFSALRPFRHRHYCATASSLHPTHEVERAARRAVSAAPTSDLYDAYIIECASRSVTLPLAIECFAEAHQRGVDLLRHQGGVEAAVAIVRGLAAFEDRDDAIWSFLLDLRMRRVGQDQLGRVIAAAAADCGCRSVIGGSHWRSALSLTQPSGFAALIRTVAASSDVDWRCAILLAGKAIATTASPRLGSPQKLAIIDGVLEGLKAAPPHPWILLKALPAVAAFVAAGDGSDHPLKSLSNALKSDDSRLARLITVVQRTSWVKSLLIYSQLGVAPATHPLATRSALKALLHGGLWLEALRHSEVLPPHVAADVQMKAIAAYSSDWQLAVRTFASLPEMSVGGALALLRLAATESRAPSGPLLPFALDAFSCVAATASANGNAALYKHATKEIAHVIAACRSSSHAKAILTSILSREKKAGERHPVAMFSYSAAALLLSEIARESMNAPNVAHVMASTWCERLVAEVAATADDEVNRWRFVGTVTGTFAAVGISVLTPPVTAALGAASTPEALDAFIGALLRAYRRRPTGGGTWEVAMRALSAAIQNAPKLHPDVGEIAAVQQGERNATALHSGVVRVLSRLEPPELEFVMTHI